MTWPCGAGGLDFREPDSHLVELIRPGFRSICWMHKPGRICVDPEGEKVSGGLIKAEKISYGKANQMYG